METKVLDDIKRRILEETKVEFGYVVDKPIYDYPVWEFYPFLDIIKIKQNKYKFDLHFYGPYFYRVTANLGIKNKIDVIIGHNTYTYDDVCKIISQIYEDMETGYIDAYSTKEECDLVVRKKNARERIVILKERIAFLEEFGPKLEDMRNELNQLKEFIEEDD